MQRLLTIRKLRPETYTDYYVENLIDDIQESEDFSSNVISSLFLRAC